jgi:hypothetical protein
LNTRTINILAFSKQIPSHRIVLPEVNTSKDFTRIKRKVMAYRLIFLGLGVFFTYVTACLYFHSPHWNLNLLLVDGSFVKNGATAFSAIFMLAALWLGCHCRASLELAKHYKRLAESEVKRIYKAKKTLTPKSKRAELYESYLLVLDQIETGYEETLHHLYDIQELPLSDSAKRRIKITRLVNLELYLDEARLAL